MSSKTIKFGEYEISHKRLTAIARTVWEATPEEWDEDWNNQSVTLQNSFIKDFVVPIPKALKAGGFGLVEIK